MGWSKALDYAKAHLRRDDAPVRVDEGLPLGARIGGILEVQLSPFVRANTGGGLVAIPEQTSELIKAISRVRISVAGSLHRFYTSAGDADDEREVFLQVYTDPKGDVSEYMHCTRLLRFIPETVDDQNAYTGEGGVGLGEPTFSLWKEQLAGMGVDPILLESAFGAKESLEYQRDAGGAEAFVKPFEGVETRIDDALGENGLKQKVFYMPYVRNLPGGGQEFLVITTEIVEEQNGLGRREIHVDFAIGLPIEKERVTVL